MKAPFGEFFYVCDSKSIAYIVKKKNILYNNGKLIFSFSQCLGGHDDTHKRRGIDPF